MFQLTPKHGFFYRLSREYLNGTPCYYHLTDQWTMAGIEGDCAEVRAVRRTEGKNDSVNHF